MRCSSTRSSRPRRSITSGSSTTWARRICCAAMRALLPRATHVSAYGLTEAGGVISFNDLDDSPDQLAETCGAPFAGVEVRIVDPETLAPLPAGERGEILIRGPTLFSGYYRDEQKTREVVTADGWLRSGDLGALAQRRTHSLSRASQGHAQGRRRERRCDRDREPSLHTPRHQGGPGDRRTRRSAPGGPCRVHRAACRRDARIRTTSIRHCVGRIASFKVPRYVYFVSEWPLSATKIQKFRLRERVREADRIDLTQFRS